MNLDNPSSGNLLIGLRGGTAWAECAGCRNHDNYSLAMNSLDYNLQYSHVSTNCCIWTADFALRSWQVKELGGMFAFSQPRLSRWCLKKVQGFSVKAAYEDKLPSECFLEQVCTAVYLSQRRGTSDYCKELKLFVIIIWMYELTLLRSPLKTTSSVFRCWTLRTSSSWQPSLSCRSCTCKRSHNEQMHWTTTLFTVVFGSHCAKRFYLQRAHSNPKCIITSGKL